MKPENNRGEGDSGDEFPGRDEAGLANQLTVSLIVFEVVVGLAGLIGGRWSGVRWAYYFRYQFNAVLLGVVGGGALFGINSLLLFTGGRRNPLFRWVYRPFARALLKVLKLLSLEDVVFISLLSGCAEELFFRGWVLSSFENKFLGLVVSSLLFGVVHVWGKQGIGYGIYAVAMGFLLGGLFIYSGNIWAPILAHIFNNLLGMLAMKYELTPGVKDT